MKILHIIHTLSSKYGGPTKALWDLATEQVQQGLDVTIYTTNLDYPRGKIDVLINREIINHNIKIYYFKVQFCPLSFSIQMAWILICRLKNYNIVHIHGIYRFPQTFAAFQARRKRIPYIIRPHGSLDPYLYNQKKNKKLKRIYEHLFDLPNLRNASAVFFSTKKERDLTNFLDITKKAIIVPNGLNLQSYQKLPAPGTFKQIIEIDLNDKIILFLGRLNFKKGLDLLIPAFYKVHQQVQNIKLVIAGPDNDGYLKTVNGWLDKFGLSDHTIITGMLNRNEVLTAFKDADIFILPSYTENFGISVIEAMACNCPIVISDQVNIWEEVNKSNSGLVTTCDVDPLYKAMMTLLNNKEKCVLMGRRGRNLVEEKYDQKKITKNVTDIYRKLISANKNN